MTQYKLIISPFAEIDLHISKEWYDLQKENLGNDFIEEVDKTILQILKNPYQFPISKRKARMAMINRYPFGIYYIIKGNAISVFAVFHFKRNPKTLKKRVQ